MEKPYWNYYYKCLDCGYFWSGQSKDRHLVQDSRTCLMCKNKNLDIKEDYLNK